MNFKAAFSTKSGIYQLWLLLLFIVVGVILSSLVSLLVGFATGSGVALNNPSTLRLIQTVSVFFSFLLPTLAIAWVCGNSISEYLSTNKLPNAKSFLLAFIGLLLFSPTINITALLNKQLVLPPFLEFLEVWMLEKEHEMEILVNLLVKDPGIGALIANLLVIALLAALTEELLFRGAIQRIIEKWTKNKDLVIWSAAILFSAIHMQFYGFVPRMLLGAYFGYLLYWSKSIWLPVFAHFTNNAIAVIAGQSQDLSENEFVSGEISNEHLAAYSLVAVATLVLFYFLNKKLKQEAGHTV